jgi:uncharacterized protein (TIGR02246 family)
MRLLPYLILAAPVLIAQWPGVAVETQVGNIVEAYHKAFEQRDVEGLRRLFAEDLLVFESGGVDRGREAYLTHHLGPELKELSAWTTSGMDMKIEAQESLAVATCAFIYEATLASGKASKGKATETLVLAKEGGQWRIRHIHWSSRAIKSVKP